MGPLGKLAVTWACARGVRARRAGRRERESMVWTVDARGQSGERRRNNGRESVFYIGNATAKAGGSSTWQGQMRHHRGRRVPISNGKMTIAAAVAVCSTIHVTRGCSGDLNIHAYEQIYTLCILLLEMHILTVKSSNTNAKNFLLVNTNFERICSCIT